MLECIPFDAYFFSLPLVILYLQIWLYGFVQLLPEDNLFNIYLTLVEEVLYNVILVSPEGQLLGHLKQKRMLSLRMI